MNKTVKIGNRTIGDGHPCFITAEAGSNHNGSFEQALALIDIAVEAGVDAVKFQAFKANKLYPKTAGKSGYLKSDKSIYDIIEEMEMPEEWVPKLAKYCKEKDLIFLCTPFNEDSVDLLEPYVPAYKVASYEMQDIPFIEYIARKNKPIIASTGAANLEEVTKAVGVIKKTGNKNLILMQCSAGYPTPIDCVNVKNILTMKNKFNVPVGLSDHSREVDIAPVAAVAIGANCIEKHFTLSNKLPGLDHKFAVEPEELKLMVQKIKQVERVLGSGEKITLDSERELRRFTGRSVYAVKNIKKGDVFSKDNIAVLRCGNTKGVLKPEDFRNVVNRKAKGNIKSSSPITRKDYE